MEVVNMNEWRVWRLESWAELEGGWTVNDRREIGKIIFDDSGDENDVAEKLLKAFDEEFGTIGLTAYKNGKVKFEFNEDDIYILSSETEEPYFQIENTNL